MLFVLVVVLLIIVVVVELLAVRVLVAYLYVPSLCLRFLLLVVLWDLRVVGPLVPVLGLLVVSGASRRVHQELKVL